VTEADVNRAVVFAAKAHESQRRKYTGEPYVAHCIEVMMLVREHGGSETMQCAALLHDTGEDCGVHPIAISDQFGYDVAAMVVALTDDETGNRAARKAASCARLSAVSAEVQTIKYADLVSNSRSIIERDPDFAKVYLREKAKLLLAMQKGNPDLWRMAAGFIPGQYWEAEAQ